MQLSSRVLRVHGGPSTHSTGLQSPVLLRQHSAPQLLPRLRRRRRRLRRRRDSIVRVDVSCVRAYFVHARRALIVRFGLTRATLATKFAPFFPPTIGEDVVTQSVFRIFNRGTQRGTARVLHALSFVPTRSFRVRSC